MIKRIILFKLFSFFIFFQVNAIQYNGGGVLPFAVNPKNNKVYLLFSREAFGKAKGKYSDFGGKAEKKDCNHPTWIAARECTEESAGVLGSYKSIQSYLSSDSKKVYKIENKNYVLYLAKVKFDYGLDYKFQIARAKAKKVHQKEKDKLVWVSLDNLKKALKSNSGTIIFKNGQSITLRSCTFDFLKNAQSVINTLK